MSDGQNGGSQSDSSGGAAQTQENGETSSEVPKVSPETSSDSVTSETTALTGDAQPETQATTEHVAQSQTTQTSSEEPTLNGQENETTETETKATTLVPHTTENQQKNDVDDGSDQQPAPSETNTSESGSVEKSTEGKEIPAGGDESDAAVTANDEQKSSAEQEQNKKDDGEETAVEGTVEPNVGSGAAPVISVIAADGSSPAAVVVVAAAAAAADSKESITLERAAVIAQSFRRRKVCQKRFMQQSQRARVARELLETEKTYVSSLELMIRLFMKPLLASARTSDAILPKQKIQSIFSVVEVMTNLNKVLLNDLQKRLDCWHVDQLLGDIFLTMGDYLKVATQYVNNYDTAVSTVSSELKTNQRFKIFYEEMREQPECRRNDLKAFLIMPVQRIPRYELLLRELIRKTPRDHPDYTPLNEAFSKIQSISALIDSRKDTSMKFQEVLRVHGMLEPKVPNLIAPTRRLLGEFPFQMQRRNGNKLTKPQAIMCFFFNDMLILGELIEEKKTLRKAKDAPPPTKEPRYKPVETVSLTDTTCSLVKEQLHLSCSKANLELVLQAVDSSDSGSSVAEFAKHFASASAAFSSGTIRAGVGTTTLRSSLELPPPQKRTPSDPSSVKGDKIMQKRIPSDPAGTSAQAAAISMIGSQALSQSSTTSPDEPEDAVDVASANAVAGSGAGSLASSGSTSVDVVNETNNSNNNNNSNNGASTTNSEIEEPKTEDDIDRMANETRLGTMQMLTNLIREMEEQLARIWDELGTVEEGSAQHTKLMQDARVIAQKVEAMRAGLQQSEAEPERPPRTTSRRRSPSTSSDAANDRIGGSEKEKEGKGVAVTLTKRQSASMWTRSPRTSAKQEQQQQATPPGPRKSLFGSLRKQRNSAPDKTSAKEVFNNGGEAGAEEAK